MSPIWRLWQQRQKYRSKRWNKVKQLQLYPLESPKIENVITLEIEIIKDILNDSLINKGEIREVVLEEESEILKELNKIRHTILCKSIMKKLLEVKIKVKNRM